MLRSGPPQDVSLHNSYFLTRDKIIKCYATSCCNVCASDHVRGDFFVFLRAMDEKVPRPQKDAALPRKAKTSGDKNKLFCLFRRSLTKEIISPCWRCSASRWSERNYLAFSAGRSWTMGNEKLKKKILSFRCNAFIRFLQTDSWSPTNILRHKK